MHKGDEAKIEFYLKEFKKLQKDTVAANGNTVLNYALQIDNTNLLDKLLKGNKETVDKFKDHKSPLGIVRSKIN